jgi:hypothetical protein
MDETDDARAERAIRTAAIRDSRPGTSSIKS